MSYDLIIVGGGAAGLTAGIYAGRARMKTLLIEKVAPGGQAASTDIIENYPGFSEAISGPELTERMAKQAERFGLEMVIDKAESLKLKARLPPACHPAGRSSGQAERKIVVKAQKKEYVTLSVIVATGGEPRLLGIPGEEELKGRGVSYCATCDGPLFRNEEIVVVGGGNTAVQEALFLTEFGRKVTLIHRRDRLRATKVLQERALSHAKIEIVWDSVVTGVQGRTRVEGVQVRNRQTGEEREIPARGVFILTGIKPSTDFLRGSLKMDEEGYIITDENMKTSREGIYACGDCRRKQLRQIVIACGEGATAAMAAQHYVDRIKGTAYGD
ncbi:thioredoxin-disulfide reductase [candidate division NPL-UPA2 bacterium]|nr:thioredoxin-disulfide reductase [candidate division NPL-UPA2 bacterium]